MGLKNMSTFPSKGGRGACPRISWYKKCAEAAEGSHGPHFPLEGAWALKSTEIPLSTFPLEGAWGLKTQR